MQGKFVFVFLKILWCGVESDSIKYTAVEITFKATNSEFGIEMRHKGFLSRGSRGRIMPKERHFNLAEAVQLSHRCVGWVRHDDVLKAESFCSNAADKSPLVWKATPSANRIHCKSSELLLCWQTVTTHTLLSILKCLTLSLLSQ